MKAWWRRVRPHLLPPLVYALIRLIMSTVKVELRNFHEPVGGGILLGWHGRIILATKSFRNRGYWIMVSQSRDGEMQNRILSRFGFKVIRGSTGRGGAQALIECIKALKGGAIFAFTPDGPRGPSGIVQMGAVTMAKKSGKPLIPVGVGTDRRWLFKSWDRYMIPKPFAHGVMIFGTPVTVPPNATDEECESIRLTIENEMRRLEAEAEALFGHPAPDWHAPQG
ncbi:MAG: lysophospholipid acyltransferase family protein [Armatimonadetes bacterium]|nr:lysophospholipid acyltransferase family protein [Armatimonadota bacterium]MBS1710793.1 lysophospholipid acyltransferase family protein [Armatimonadota bacterium]MBX3108465.1 lysophospholipid acyltransferase family protein [Fimbriimonadaceae bacterium]